MGFNRRELLRMVAVLAAVWALVMLLLTVLQRSAKPGRIPTEPLLVHYPGYEDVEEQTSENLGFRKYWFTLNEDYPSKSVYYFYKNLLEAEGWRPLAAGEPQWTRQTTDEEARDLFHAVWVSPDSLFQIELQMLSTVQLVRQQEAVVLGEREPGIQVFVTQRRALHPGIIFRPRAPAPERGIRGPDL
jgi:hypothetical protein